jgi:uncharacterized protein YndB with AHSA1/START domain
MKNNDDYAQFPAPGEIRIMRTLPGPIERLWTHLTDPEKRRRWLAGGPMELRAGGKMELYFQHKNVSPTETPPAEHACKHNGGKSMVGTILRCEPPRVLSFTFGENSDVTFELIPQDENVLLILTHRIRGDDLPAVLGFASGWHAHLAILFAQLEDAPAPPFWATHARLRAEYEKRLTA